MSKGQENVSIPAMIRGIIKTSESEVTKMAQTFKGMVEIQNAAAARTIGLDGDRAEVAAGGSGQDGDIVVKDGNGNRTVWIRGKVPDVLLGVRLPGEIGIYLDGGEGDILVRRRILGVEREVLKFDASDAALQIGSEGSDGDFTVRDSAGRSVLHFDGNYAALHIGAKGNEGDVIVRDGAGAEAIRLDGHTGDIKLKGADCAEEFDVAQGCGIPSGTVVVIAEEGKLRPCSKPYDTRVAGVVSGANGCNPAIILNSNPARDERLPVALSGKVYCRVDAQFSPIEVGDLLTSSPRLGHAMKAEDPTRAFGAVVGKALSPLKEGTALIPVLVALQ